MCDSLAAVIPTVNVGTYGGPSDIKCIFSTIRKQQQGIFRENYPDFLLSILESPMSIIFAKAPLPKILALVMTGSNKI